MGSLLLKLNKLNKFPVHKILYTNNEDRIIITVNQTSWIWTELWFVISSSVLKSVMFCYQMRILHYLVWNRDSYSPSFCSRSFCAIFKPVDSLPWGFGPPITGMCLTSLHAGCTLLFKVHCELVTLTRYLISVEQIWEVTNVRHARLYSLPSSVLLGHFSEQTHGLQDSIYKEMAKVTLESKQVLKVKGKASVQRTFLTQ